MTTNPPTSIDAYIAGFPETTQALLQQIRLTIKQAAPDAEEVISYGIPTLKLKGNLVHFAGYKNHIGFYPLHGLWKRLRKNCRVIKGRKALFNFHSTNPFRLI
ncbi:iron chaperone [Spirosoma telluris]|uniref:iron chaperone n=1 Tax=Spirosoma telluris TaxID=2183553 RepID=UPI002FC28E3E